jgi:hypothetical protein
MRLLWAVLLLGGLALGQRLDAVTPRDAQAIRTVIDSQLEAFRKDDGEKAFSFASPGIREQFGSAGRFLEMVRSSYPAVYRPKRYEFRQLAQQQGIPVQVVYFEDEAGGRFLGYYYMQKQPSGTWRINGVYLEEFVPEKQGA